MLVMLLSKSAAGRRSTITMMKSTFVAVLASPSVSFRIGSVPSNASSEVATPSASGSAPAMANQVCDGYTLLSATVLKRLSLDQLKQLEFEMDKKLRNTRSDQPDLSDQQALQERNRRISRLEGPNLFSRYS